MLEKEGVTRVRLQKGLCTVKRAKSDERPATPETFLPKLVFRERSDASALNVPMLEGVDANAWQAPASIRLRLPGTP
jgi:hypothetical protein